MRFLFAFYSSSCFKIGHPHNPQFCFIFQVRPGKYAQAVPSVGGSLGFPSPHIVVSFLQFTDSPEPIQIILKKHWPSYFQILDNIILVNSVIHKFYPITCQIVFYIYCIWVIYSDSLQQRTYNQTSSPEISKFIIVLHISLFCELLCVLSH